MGNSKTICRFLCRLHFTVFGCILLGFLNDISAQYNFLERDYFTPKIDTLFSTHRSGGVHIDSLDKKFYNDFPTLFNVGRSYLPFFQPIRNWGSHRHFFSDERPVYRNDFHFTALPYTGIFYSFGSGGEQVVDLRYTQNVGNNFNLSFQYHRTSSDVMKSSFLMRNIEVLANDVSLKLHYHKKRLNSFFSGYYSSDNQKENFGIDSTSPYINELLLQQLPVINRIADARIRRAQVNFRNEFAILKDSTNSFLFVSQLGFQHFQRRYRDSVDLSFANWVYDSTTTRDYWQEPHLLLDNGILLKRKGWNWYGGFLLDYFTFINRDLRESRFDGIIQSAFELNLGKLFWATKLRYFVFGTPGEYRIASKLNFDLTEQWHLGADVQHERFYPEFFQIHFHGNHINYNNSSLDISPTLRTFVEPHLSYGLRKQIRLSVAYLNVNNLYSFQGGNWDFAVDQNVIAPSLSWQLKKGVFGWNGKAQYILGSKNLLFAPDYLISTRLFFDGALFAAKRLKVATGVEAQFFDGYETMQYHPEIGIYGQYLGASTRSKPALILNAFVNIQMDRFRFFASANRLNTLFEPEVTYPVFNYPLRPFFIRMGVVWDFVN